MRRKNAIASPNKFVIETWLLGVARESVFSIYFPRLAGNLAEKSSLETASSAIQSSHMFTLQQFHVKNRPSRTKCLD